jgi:hypothetical protein
MSAEDWVRAARTEEQRLLDEIAKTTLYKQLEAVQAVIALYQGTIESPKTSEQSTATVAATKPNGQASRHSFKAANAFSDLPDAAADACSDARDRNSPAIAHQISLQRSAIGPEHQPIRAK